MEYLQNWYSNLANTNELPIRGSNKKAKAKEMPAPTLHNTTVEQRKIIPAGSIPKVIKSQEVSKTFESMGPGEESKPKPYFSKQEYPHYLNKILDSVETKLGLDKLQSTDSTSLFDSTVVIVEEFRPLISTAIGNILQFFEKHILADNKGHQLLHSLPTEIKQKLYELHAVEKEIEAFLEDFGYEPLNASDDFNLKFKAIEAFSLKMLPPVASKEAIERIKELHIKRQELRNEFNDLKIGLQKDKSADLFPLLHTNLVSAVKVHFQRLNKAYEIIQHKYPHFDFYPPNFQDFLIIEAIISRGAKDIPLSLPKLSLKIRQAFLEYAELMHEAEIREQNDDLKPGEDEEEYLAENREFWEHVKNIDHAQISAMDENLGKLLNHGGLNAERLFIEHHFANTLLMQIMFPNGIDFGPVKSSLLELGAHMNAQDFLNMILGISIAVIVHSMSDPDRIDKAVDILLSLQTDKLKKIESMKSKIQTLTDSKEGLLQKESTIRDRLKNTIETLEKRDVKTQELLLRIEPLKIELEVLEKTLQKKENEKIKGVDFLTLPDAANPLFVSVISMERHVKNLKSLINDKKMQLEPLEEKLRKREEKFNKKSESWEYGNSTFKKELLEIKNQISKVDEQIKENTAGLSKMEAQEEVSDQTLIDTLLGKNSTSKKMLDDYKSLGINVMNLLLPNAGPLLSKIAQTTGVDDFLAIEGETLMTNVLEQFALNLHQDMINDTIDQLFAFSPPKEVLDFAYEELPKIKGKISSEISHVLLKDHENPPQEFLTQGVREKMMEKRRDDIEFLLENKIRKNFKERESGIRKEIDDLIIYGMTNALASMSENAYKLTKHAPINRMLIYRALSAINKAIQECTK